MYSIEVLAPLAEVAVSVSKSAHHFLSLRRGDGHAQRTRGVKRGPFVRGAAAGLGGYSARGKIMSNPGGPVPPVLFGERGQRLLAVARAHVVLVVDACAQRVQTGATLCLSTGHRTPAKACCTQGSTAAPGSQTPLPHRPSLRSQLAVKPLPEMPCATKKMIIIVPLVDATLHDEEHDMTASIGASLVEPS